MPDERALARFAYAPGTYRFEVRTDATVELVGSRERESVATAARVTYTLAPTARAVTLSGEVDSLVVRASARVTGGAGEPRAEPMRFRGTVDARAARLELEGVAPQCALPTGATRSAALASARETVLRVPAAIPVGTRWRDSATVGACSGEIPTTVTTVARYEVVGRARFDGADVVRVRRETTTTSRGQGFARGRQVTIAGSGAGEGSVYLDPLGGRVVGAESEGRTTVRVVVGRDPAQEFTQQVRTRVTAR